MSPICNPFTSTVRAALCVLAVAAPSLARAQTSESQADGVPLDPVTVEADAPKKKKVATKKPPPPATLPGTIVNEPENEQSVGSETKGLGAAGSLDLTSTAVTGSRLGLTPMETPASVEVINREQILQRGDTKVIDAVTRATGITGMGGPNNGGTALVSRGFAGNSTVAQLYDGTRIDTMGLGSLSFPFDTWMADRIEVLRGPASVLYGSGAIGGVINVVTKKPNTERFEHEAFASYGSDNTTQFAAGSGGPISDKLAYRFDISSQRSDGWVDRGDSESLAASGQLRFDPTSDFTLLLTYDYARQEPMKYWGTPTVNGSIDQRMRFKNYNTRDASLLHHDQMARAKAEWRISDSLVLSNELYHVKYDRHWFAIEQFAWDNGQVRRTGFTDSRHWREQTGDRFDATITSSLFGLPMRTVVGADAAINNYETLAFNRSGSSLVDPFNFDPGYSIPYTGSATGSGQFSDMTQRGVFAENRIELTKQLSVVSGLRYDDYELDYKNRDGTTNENDPSYLSWRAGAVYNIVPGLALYGQYATGSDPESVMYSREDAKLTTGRQIEAGAKATFLDGRGELTFAWYDIVKNDLLTRDPLNPDIQIQIGQQSSQGIELTGSLRVTDTLSINANGALLEAQYDEFNELVGGVKVSRAGNTPTNVPTKTANAWVSWGFTDLWTANAGIRYVGERNANTANTVKFPDYVVVDASLEWEATDNAVVRFHASNIFDEIYVNGPALFNGSSWILGEPRSFGVATHVKF